MSLQHRLRSGPVRGSSYRKAKIRYVPRVSSLDASIKRPNIVGLVVKPIGKPSAGNRHARFDERGWETERWPMAPSYRAHPRLYQRCYGASGDVRSRSLKAPGLTISMPTALLASSKISTPIHVMGRIALRWLEAERVVELGDRAWRDVLTQHTIIPLCASNSVGIAVAKSILPVTPFLASFDGPARAVRCGRAIVDTVRKL